MGNSLRCCIACVLPCGALDVIRIVHLNGRMDEFSHPVSAQEILAAHPGHVLSTPCSSQGPGVTGRILIVSPKSQLKRGGFYFLIPPTSVPDTKIYKKKKISKSHNNHNNSCNYKREEKVGHSRRRCRRVGVWRPRLDSILEDPLS